MPFPLQDADSNPIVVWLEERRAQRLEEMGDNDPLPRPSQDDPPEVPAVVEVNRVEDSTSRIRNSTPPVLDEVRPQTTTDFRFAEHSSDVAQTNHEDHARLEPSINQAIESLIDGNPRSVSYLRSLFGRSAVQTTHGNDGMIRSTEDLFSLEIAGFGEEELDPSDQLRNLESPGSMTNVRLVSDLALPHHRDSSNNWSGRDNDHSPIHDEPARGSNHL